MDYRAYYAAVDLCRHRWTLEILTVLRDRPARFTDLIQNISPTPHAKSLDAALKRLQRRGLISHPADGDGALYELTDAGRALLPLLLAFLEDLHRWEELHCDTSQRRSRRP